MITIGSLFSGIGGFELGLERAIPNSKTKWQVEQDKYCQSILKKHWPEATLHNDIREVNHENVHPVNIICGGFPCQDISEAGKGAGIEHGIRSSLWGEMYRLIDELRPRIAVMENVNALRWKKRGLHIIMSNLAKIGYDAEWKVISARQFGAPHLRKRIFIVAYPNRCTMFRGIYKNNATRGKITTNPHTIYENKKFKSVEKKKQKLPREISNKRESSYRFRDSNTIDKRENYWQRIPIQAPVYRVDDGFSNRVDRMKALGNAIVPQCSEYIGQCIVNSGLLNDLY